MHLNTLRTVPIQLLALLPIGTGSLEELPKLCHAELGDLGQVIIQMAIHRERSNQVAAEGEEGRVDMLVVVDSRNACSAPMARALRSEDEKGDARHNFGDLDRVEVVLDVLSLLVQNALNSRT
jgi:hypothetical protein